MRSFYRRWNHLTVLVISILSFNSVQSQNTVLSDFGDLTQCDTMTKGAFIVWWDKEYDLSDDVSEMLDSMNVYRNICLNQLQMLDPNSVVNRVYINIYIHGDGHFNQYGWGNGVGGDSNGYPFFTCPMGLQNDYVNLAHEIFHILQWNGNSPGFESEINDAFWYIEASANWFSARQNPDAARRFPEAESLVRLPHMPLWVGFTNFPDTYPENWQRYVRQYALSLWLYYLTDVVGIGESIITSGMYGAEQTQLPQEYFYRQVGTQAYRRHFIDWAARMTNDFDFLPAYQAQTSLDEWGFYADPNDDNEFTATFDKNGTNGWFIPPSTKVTNAWSYNVYKINNDTFGNYSFQVNGFANGTYGDPSYFQGKVLIKKGANSEFYDFDMSNAQQGSISLALTPAESEIYVIIASMPEVFKDDNRSFQQFPYLLRISRNDILTSNLDLQSDHIDLYPSSIDGVFKITGDLTDYSIQILSQNGAIHQDLSNLNGPIDVDLTALPSGMYFVKVINNSNNQIFIEQVIKQ